MEAQPDPSTGNLALVSSSMPIRRSSPTSQLVYSSSLLPFHPHNLTIVAMSATSNGAASGNSYKPSTFALDFLEYTGLEPRDSNASNCDSHHHHNRSCTSSAHTGSHRGLSGGAIAGIVVGLLLLALLLIALLYWDCRRRRRTERGPGMRNKTDLLSDQAKPNPSSIIFYTHGQISLFNHILLKLLMELLRATVCSYEM